MIDFNIVFPEFKPEIRFPKIAKSITKDSNNNSFLHFNQGIFDLTKLAQAFDRNGGGHPNACGCRIMPIEKGKLARRELNEFDIEKNIEEWLKIWGTRSKTK